MQQAAQWKVRVPSWRPDLAAAIDLVEEVIRIDGYEKVPATLPTAPAGRGLTASAKTATPSWFAFSWPRVS